MFGKNKKKSKLFLDVIFIFILPQIFMGIFFHFFHLLFSPKYLLSCTFFSEIYLSLVFIYIAI